MTERTAHLAAVEARARTWRRELHQIPETAFEEHRTSAYVAGVLRELGYAVATGIGGTGLVGSLTRGASGRTVGLRCELDGLPLTEHSSADHPSRHPGRMHACGHDGHLAMLLGAAATLAEDPDLDGTVHLILQPAEEPGQGAQAMVDDGLFERYPMDRLFGIHNAPGFPAGHLHTRPGPVMASEDNFTIAVTGRGGHASAPHLVIDPLVVAAEIILALQHVVARSVDPVRTAVISCTDIQTDGARNAIPSHVTITGDTRSFDPESKTCSSAASARSATVSPPPTARPPRSPTPMSSRPRSTTRRRRASPAAPPRQRSARRRW